MDVRLLAPVADMPQETVISSPPSRASAQFLAIVRSTCGSDDQGRRHGSGKDLGRTQLAIGRERPHPCRPSMSPRLMHTGSPQLIWRAAVGGWTGGWEGGHNCRTPASYPTGQRPTASGVRGIWRRRQDGDGDGRGGWGRVFHPAVGFVSLCSLLVSVCPFVRLFLHAASAAAATATATTTAATSSSSPTTGTTYRPV